MKRFIQQRSTWPVALGLAVVAALMFAGVASAAGPALQQVGDTALENYFKREQIAFNDQGLRLQAADTITGKTQTWIDALKGKGKDTSALESALAAYKTQIASAQSDHDASGQALNAKAGFDSNGKVTDRKTALQTVIDAGKPMRQAHLTLVQGTLDFRSAVLAWRTANK